MRAAYDLSTLGVNLLCLFFFSERRLSVKAENCVSVC